MCDLLRYLYRGRNPAVVREDLPEKPGISGVAYLLDGKIVATGENDGDVIQWDLVDTGKEFRHFRDVKNGVT